jgi:flagella basal body P-ring formation protein FlgA
MRYAGLLLAVAALLGAVPTAAPPATLRAESIVNGDTVRLGDLFDHVGDKAGTVIGRAPAPGGRAVYDAPFLMRVAAAFGVRGARPTTSIACSSSEPAR